MKHGAALVALALLTGSAAAYTGQELRDDCQAADDLYAGQRSTDPYQSVRSARCISYLAGFADGYAIGDFLADKVGVRLGAFCLPQEHDLSPRLVRAVLAQFDRIPPSAGVNNATLVASALSRSFPCTGKLEPGQ